MVEHDREVNQRRGARAESPHPIHPEDSPLWPKHLFELFLHPTRFFSSQLALGKTPYVVLVTWCYGVANAIDQIDREMLRAQYGTPRLSLIVGESWLAYWAFTLVVGSIGGLFVWWVGGWWYRVRLRWAGDPAPDKRLARLVYIYSSFVWAGPAVIVALVQTLLFANYQQAWNAEEMYSLGLLIFLFWSLVTSYWGARTLFNVSTTRALVWFLVLPTILYVAMFIGAATLLAWISIWA